MSEEDDVDGNIEVFIEEPHDALGSVVNAGGNDCKFLCSVDLFRKSVAETIGKRFFKSKAWTVGGEDIVDLASAKGRCPRAIIEGLSGNIAWSLVAFEFDYVQRRRFVQREQIYESPMCRRNLPPMTRSGSPSTDGSDSM
ncbi:hypothetical protein ARTSIC4J27_1998 [Pseudarthrobacter siccitolerans]|uniref:Uncharacterized protein n=1 Tax=Pseudarthrobacter siccitolerans TaxID=861266 RepID=A0A024H228_9MICC|nr:hypothetical protein [Pseudarthrobacter siccitolerans]CCQ46038.1 hypothetical protein ARTSIC4J27_1998 [Pseudarthrobacter siccitolerans]